MIETAPFPFADLTEARRRTGRADDPADGGTGSIEPGPRGKSADPDDAPEAQRRFTADDLAEAVAEARQAALAEAEADVRAAMADDIEQRRCQALEAIRDQLVLHKQVFDGHLVGLASVSQSLAVEMARAVTPKALQREPLLDIADMVADTLAGLIHQPSIELRLPPVLLDMAYGVMQPLADEAGFRGEITVVADPSLAVGDAELRWRGGRVERRLDHLHAAAADLVDHWLPAPALPDLDDQPNLTGQDASAPAEPTLPPPDTDDEEPKGALTAP